MLTESRCRLPGEKVQLPKGRLLFRRPDLEIVPVVPGFEARTYTTLDHDLRVIAGMEPYLADGVFRLHVSFSHLDRLPDWETIKQVKEAFFGDEVEAVVVLPKAKHYVNRHPFTHHLWESPEEWND
jgi:hypothetical protein